MSYNGYIFLVSFYTYKIDRHTALHPRSIVTSAVHTFIFYKIINFVNNIKQGRVKDYLELIYRKMNTFIQKNLS